MLFATTLVANNATAGTVVQFNVLKWIIAALSNHWIFLIFIALVIILLIATLLLKGKLSIKLPGGVGLDIGSENKKTKEIDNPHSKCPYSIDFRHTFTKTTYIISKISEIRYRGCLEEQINHVKEQFVNIRTLYQRSYLEKMKEKLKEKDELETEDKYLYEDYRYYQAIVKLMIHDMESVIRASFINNHLVSYTEEDYQRYIDLKFNVIKALEIDFIDTMYIGNWIISRDEIFEIHKQNRDELQKIVVNMYIGARRIAFIKKKEIEKLEEELQEYMNSTVGNDIKIEKTTDLR